MISTLDALTLEQVLAESAGIITVNNRLAKHLRESSDRLFGHYGQTVWSSVAVLPLNTWLRQYYTELVDRGGTRRRLLSPFEENLLWERVIASSLSGSALLRPSTAVQAAASAYRLVIEWRLALPPARTPETTAFLAWYQAFEAECRDQGWLPAARLVEEIVEAIDSNAIQAREKLVLAGFDDLTPLLELLVQTLALKGAKLARLAEPADPAPPARFIARDRNEETRTAVAWAISRRSADAAARIAIVVPDLADTRGLIDNQFAHFAHTMAHGPEAAAWPPHEFSLGLPLGDYPIVNDALLVLDLALGDRPQAVISAFFALTLYRCSRTRIRTSRGTRCVAAPRTTSQLWPPGHHCRT